MIHFASPSFWEVYEALPPSVKRVADRNFEMFKINPKHPSLHSKNSNSYWSVRAGIDYRALAVDVENGLPWFWIGSHAEYDKLIKPYRIN
ncbi:MAG: hypothetical protein ABL863_02645 [Nitrosomonas sp.]